MDTDRDSSRCTPPSTVLCVDADLIYLLSYHVSNKTLVMPYRIEKSQLGKSTSIDKVMDWKRSKFFDIKAINWTGNLQAKMIQHCFGQFLSMSKQQTANNLPKCHSAKVFYLAKKAMFNRKSIFMN